MTLDPELVLDGVLERTLPKPQWTHEAHVAACWAAVRRHGVDEALIVLRSGIKRYNEATGVANTPTSGYHESITRYFVDAVGRLAEEPFAAVVADPTVARDAPLDHWSRERLFSVEARAAWVEPDVAPLLGR